MDSGVIIILGMGGIFYLFYVLYKMPGVKLQKKFIRMGVLKGIPYQEIVEVVGLPNMVMGGQKTWSAGTYSITLIFDENDICKGVSLEYNVNF